MITCKNKAQQTFKYDKPNPLIKDNEMQKISRTGPNYYDYTALSSSIWVSKLNHGLKGTCNISGTRCIYFGITNCNKDFKISQSKGIFDSWLIWILRNKVSHEWSYCFPVVLAKHSSDPEGLPLQGSLATVREGLVHGSSADGGPD